MKLKIKFGKETRFDVPARRPIHSWTQRLSGTGLSFRALAVAERPKLCKRHVD